MSPTFMELGKRNDVFSPINLIETLICNTSSDSDYCNKYS